MKYDLISKNLNESITLSNNKETSLFFEKNLIIELGSFQFIPEKPEKRLYSTHRYWYQSDLSIRPIHTIKHLAGTYFIALDGHMRGQNHSHFIQQIFLSLLVAKRYKLDFRKIPILINTLDKTKKEFLSLLGDLTLIEIPFQNHCALFVENAIFAQTLFGFQTSKELAHLYSDFRDTLSLPKSHYNDKIYLSRKDSVNRRAINEDDVIKYMQKRDFSIVELGNIPIIEQISTFANAHTIIGPHGAGGANLYFANNGVRFFEMFSHGRIGSCHANIAFSKNCQYSATLNSDSISTCATFAQDSNYIIDLELLDYALESPYTKLQSLQNPTFFHEFPYAEEEVFAKHASWFTSEKEMKTLLEQRIENIHTFLPEGMSYFYKSFTYFYKNDYEQARKYCEKACEIEVNNIYFYKQLLLILKFQLDTKSILKLTSKTKEIFPYWGEPYYQLSLVYFTTDDSVKAKTFAKIALEINPDNNTYKAHFQALNL